MSKYRNRRIQDPDVDRQFQDVYKILNEIEAGRTTVVVGGGSSGGSGSLDETYAWDYTSHSGNVTGTTITGGNRLEEIVVRVDTAFDGNTMISIDDGVDILMETYQSDLGTETAFSTGKVFKKYITDTDLTVTFSGSPTVGEGIIIFKIKSI